MNWIVENWQLVAAWILFGLATLVMLWLPMRALVRWVKKRRTTSEIRRLRQDIARLRETAAPATPAPMGAQEPVDLYEPCGTLPVVGDTVRDFTVTWGDSVLHAPCGCIVGWKRIGPNRVRYWVDDAGKVWCEDGFHEGGTFRILKRQPAPVAHAAPYGPIGDTRIEGLAWRLAELERRVDAKENRA